MFGWGQQKACSECETLRAELKRLRGDVEDIADKVFHWMKRHSARAAREGTAVAGGAEAATPAVSTDGEAAVSPRVAALLARRRNASMVNGRS